MLSVKLYDQWNDPVRLNRQPLDQLCQDIVQCITDGLAASSGQFALALPLTGVEATFLRLTHRSHRMSWVPSRLGGPAKLMLHTPHQQVGDWIIESLMTHCPHLVTQLTNGRLAITAVSTIDQLRLEFSWSPTSSPLNARLIIADRSE